MGAASLHRREGIYPTMMIVVGAHYLPFTFLYGMRQFIALAGLLLGPGLLVGLYAPQMAVAGGVFTSAILVVFALIGRKSVRREAGRTSAPH